MISLGRAARMLSNKTVRFRSFSSCGLSKVTWGALRMRWDGASADDADALLWSRGRCSRAAASPFAARRSSASRSSRAARRRAGAGCPAARRSAAPRLFLLRRRGRAEGPAVLAPRGAEAPLGLRACLGHRGRSAGSRSAVASLLFAAVRAWRSSQAFPVKRRRSVAGRWCRGPRRRLPRAPVISGSQAGGARGRAGQKSSFRSVAHAVFKRFRAAGKIWARGLRCSCWMGPAEDTPEA